MNLMPGFSAMVLHSQTAIHFCPLPAESSAANTFPGVTIWPDIFHDSDSAGFVCWPGHAAAGRAAHGRAAGLAVPRGCGGLRREHGRGQQPLPRCAPTPQRSSEHLSAEKQREKAPSLETFVRKLGVRHPKRDFQVLPRSIAAWKPRLETFFGTTV